MRHLRRSAGRPTGEIEFVDDRTFQASASCIEDDTCSVRATTNNQEIVLLVFLLQSFELFVTISQFKLIFHFSLIWQVWCIAYELRCAQLCQSIRLQVICELRELYFLILVSITGIALSWISYPICLHIWKHPIILEPQRFSIIFRHDYLRTTSSSSCQENQLSIWFGKHISEKYEYTVFYI